MRQLSRDLTRFMARLESHGGTPIGQETWTCLCGRVFNTGFKEWDHLSYREQQAWLGGSHVAYPALLVIFAIVGIPFGAIAYVTVGSWKLGFFASLIFGCGISDLPRFKVTMEDSRITKTDRSYRNVDFASNHIT